MGAGFQRVTPVHVAGMLKQYRRLLGEVRYSEQHEPEQVQRLVELRKALVTLQEAIRICDPDADMQQLKPIAFRPPVLLTRAHMTRELLKELRDAKAPLEPAEVAHRIIERLSLDLASKSLRELFERSVHRVGSSLVKRRLVRLQDTAWNL